MGYSTPKKQLDLKDFLSKPSAPGRRRTSWSRGAMATKTPTEAKKAKGTPAAEAADSKATPA